MSNIIREDVVQVSFDVDLQEIKQLMKELNELKKKLSGGLGDEAFDELGDSASGAKDDVESLTKENKELRAEIERLKSGVGQLDNKFANLAKKGAAAAFNVLKKIAAISFKTLLASVTAIAAGIGVITKQAVAAFADYEQLVGGVETLFGAKGAKNIEEYAKIVGKSVSSVEKEYGNLMKAEKLVLDNANNAYKTAGLSANDYMSTVTTFSASLIKSLDGDTVKAAELADIALQDMADNANKMGTDISMIQSAYSGIARGNYMMLDNLKLGYAGSKTELERLLKDAEKIKKEMGETVDYDINSYADVIEAIHTIQENMGITGTTAKEAKETVTGSLNAMKAAWGNLLIAMGSGEGLEDCMDNMIETAETFIGNVMPVIEKALVGMGTLIERVVPIIEEKLPDLAEQLLPPLIKAAVSLVKGLIKALPNILKTLATTIVDIFGEQFPIIKKIGDFFAENAGKIAEFVPVLIGIATAIAAFGKIKAVGSLFSGLFGKGGANGTDAAGGSGGGLFSGLANLAKMKTTSVLKGMANLTIVLGGLALLIPLLMFIVPLIDALGGVPAFLKMVLVFGAMGILGGVLGKFAGIVGNIPIATVAKGLANMAIVVAGTAALFLLLGATSLLEFDYLRILALVGILAVLGVVGSALAVFAAIAGCMPITSVLLGLANIALVLAGLTAVIIAFGALARIDGLQEFVTTGGELLASIAGVLGKVVGAFVGGLGAGLTEGLPIIGENLAEFGENIKPMLESFSGVDMSGVGSFFASLGGFLLAVTGNGIVDALTSWFTGGTSLSQIGTDLATFAENSEGFFTKIATFPENSFTNATKLFEALSGLGGLPNSGGVVGWFCGDVDYSKIASGLGDLSGENTTRFLNMVSGIAPETFEKVTKFFDSISGIGGLPNSGGVAGWFSGEINYTDIANGLAALGAEGVKNFFLMAESLTPKAFENTKLLFESLGGMSESLPEEDNWWDKLWGTDKVSLGDIATDLGTFAKNSKSFFTMVNSLNLTNLNGLWESLKNADGLTADISKKVGENIDDMVSKISKLPAKMGEALKNASKPLADSFVEVWKAAVEASVAPVNKLLSGANHILKEFGSKKTVIEWQPYARGTSGHRGGNALVNDGRGAELVQMPNGNTFIPNGRNVFIPNAPKGMRVLSAENTAHLMGRNSPTFSYANGIGNIDIWSYYDNAKGLVGEITKNISYSGMSGFASNLGKGMVSTFAGEMPAWVEKLFEECGQSISSYVASKGATQWLPTVVRALKMEGQYSAANVARTLFQMRTESGGNPRAINLWDSNAKKGIPSKGLMQVIDPTFRAYARSGFNKNIYDPLSNILASIRYAVSRYGSLSRAYRGVGYENGGFANSPSIFGENGLEVAIPLKSSKRNRALSLWSTTGEMLGVSYSAESDSGYASTSVEYNTYAPVFEAHFHGVTDERTLRRNVKRWIAESFDDMVDEMERSNPS